MSIEVKKGDLFASNMQVLTNATNCLGIMGAGIAAAFKERYPEMYKDYVERCKEGREKVGFPHLWENPDKFGKDVLNFPTMKDPGVMAKIDDVEAGLVYLREHLEVYGIKSIAIPALGCGIGGLEFAQVEDKILEVFEGVDIHIEIYAPLV